MCAQQPEIPVLTVRCNGYTARMPDSAGDAGLVLERGDEGWDELARAARASYHQTSAWSRAKATSGWETRRVVVQGPDGSAQAGAQLLLKGPRGARVGYLPRGPFCRPGREELLRDVLAGLPGVCRSLNVRYLVMVPPYGSGGRCHGSPELGWVPAPPFTHPHTEATTVVDLGADDDVLLRSMTGKTRRNVQLAVRRGVDVVQGQRADLAELHAVLTSTGGRQGFAVPPLEQFQRVWDALHPSGSLQLFLVRRDGQPVSAGLWITHDETVTFWRGGWTGNHGRDSPNQGMHWGVMRWAREHGFRAYDLEGVSRESADLVLAGGSRDVPDSVDAFKLGFGGRVEVSPPAQALAPSRLGRLVLVPAVDGLERAPLGRRLRALMRR